MHDYDLRNRPYKKAVAEYKKNNICGNNDAQIGIMLIQYEKKPEEGIEYTLQAYLGQLSIINNILNGYIRYYIAVKELARGIRAAEWMIRYLGSLKENPEKRSFLDKIICLYHLLTAVMLDADNRAEEAEAALHTAVRIARTFDADPVYSMENILFTETWNKPGSFYDSSGPTAIDGLKGTLAEAGDLVTASFLEKFDRALQINGY